MAAEDRERAPAKYVYVRIAHSLWTGAVEVVLLTYFDVGTFWWWWGIVGLPISAGLLVYWLVDLVRNRHVRTKEREGQWTPWG